MYNYLPFGCIGCNNSFLFFCIRSNTLFDAFNLQLVRNHKNKYYTYLNITIIKVKMYVHYETFSVL